MNTAVDEIRNTLRRRAIVMDIGGFRPPDSRAASWFGSVNLALPGETWPHSDGKPMHALCQINLLDLPYRPPRLDDLEFISVFIGPSKLPSDKPNGERWCLRAYRSLAELRSLEVVETGSCIKSFPMRPRAVDDDFPCWEDAGLGIPEEIANQYYDLFHNVPGFKMGGWPSLIQSEICWAAWNKHPISPEYVFQIDTSEKGNWTWGDNGVGYFGRGTADGHRNEWALEWQCY